MRCGTSRLRWCGRARAGLTDNLNVNFAIADVIGSAGRVPGSVNVGVRLGTGSARALRALGLPRAAQVITLTRARTADGTPVADVTDVLPVERLTEVGIDADDMVAIVIETESMQRALDKIGLVIHDGIAEISPATATDLQGRRLQIKRNALRLRISQVDYLSEGEPVVSPTNSTSPTHSASPSTAKTAVAAIDVAPPASLPLHRSPCIAPPASLPLHRSA